MIPHHKEVHSSRLPNSTEYAMGDFTLPRALSHFSEKDITSDRLYNFTKITDLNSGKASIY